MTPLRHQREAAGLSQQALADRIGLSRQAYGAIEAGRATPGVDVALALARVFATSVEQLFGGGTPDTATRAIAGADLVAGARVMLARVGDVVVALPVPAATPAHAADGHCVDGGAAGSMVVVDGFDGEGVARAISQRVVVAGCALGLGVIAERLNAEGSAGRFLWWPTSNAGARGLLRHGHVHLAAFHLEDGDDDDDGDDGHRAVTMGRWELGCATRQGDRRVQDGDDLRQRGLRLVHREAGAGAEALLRSLVGHGRRSDGPVVSGHLDVARAVAFGAADAGICARDAASTVGLRFVPLREERVVVRLASDTVDDTRVARFLDALASRAVRRELDALGYDTRDSGVRRGA